MTLKAEYGKIQRQVITRKGESGRESEGCLKLERLYKLIHMHQLHHLVLDAFCIINIPVHIGYPLALQPHLIKPHIT